MKTTTYLSIIILFGFLGLGACGGGGDKETAEEAFIKQLAATWQMQEADFDGKDVSNSFPGLVVTFSTSKSISVQNAVAPMWKGSSTFELVEVGNDFLISRNDGLEILVEEMTETHLVLSFHYDPDALGGRMGSVTGGFTFEFNKK